jgi:hypothetical protein
MEGTIFKARPTSYAVENVVRGEPRLRASSYDPGTPTAELDAYPSYRANATLTFKSKAGTSTNRMVVYSVTWITKRKDWYVMEVSRPLHTREDGPDLPSTSEARIPGRPEVPHTASPPPNPQPSEPRPWCD